MAILCVSHSVRNRYDRSRREWKIEAKSINKRNRRIIVPIRARHAVDHQTGTKMDWEKENMLLFLPFYHIYGFSVICYSILESKWSFLTISIAITCSVNCRNSFFLRTNSLSQVYSRLQGIDQVLYSSILSSLQISQLMLVPPILVFLAKHPICAKFDLSSIKRIASGEIEE